MIILGYLRLSPVSKVWLGELFELLARNLDNGDDVVVDVDDDDNVENGKEYVTCQEARPPAGWLQSHLPRLNRSTLVMKMMLMMIVATILMTTLLNVDHDENTEPGPGPWLPPLPPDAPSLQVHDHHQHHCCHHYKHQHCHHRQQHHWLQHLGLECGAGLLPRDFILLEKRSESKIENVISLEFTQLNHFIPGFYLYSGELMKSELLLSTFYVTTEARKLKFNINFIGKARKWKLRYFCVESPLCLHEEGREVYLQTKGKKDGKLKKNRKQKYFLLKLRKLLCWKGKRLC